MIERIRVVVADDHPMFLDGLTAALRATEDIEVVGVAADARSAVQATRDQLPDVALLDVNMPGDGLQAARDIAIACPATRIIMLTVSEDENDIMAAMTAGASGYALKGIPAREIVGIIRSVSGGEVYVAPSLAWAMLREMTKRRIGDRLDELSPREREVLELVAAGLSNAEVGARLGLAEKTIKHYMTNVLGKLQVGSRVEAAVLAHKANLSGRPKGPRG